MIKVTKQKPTQNLIHGLSLLYSTYYKYKMNEGEKINIYIYEQFLHCTILTDMELFDFLPGSLL